MNPELRRNLWIELSVHRLIAAPATLALIFLLAYASPTYRSIDYVATAAMVIALAMLMVWGTRSAADTVTEEVRNRTWDAQRMCATGPWAMTWGKLFGSTAFSWYAGGICLAVLLFTTPATWRFSGLTLVILIGAAAVTAHGFSLTVSLLSARKGVSAQAASGVWLLVLLFVFMSPMINLVRELEPALQWWGAQRDGMAFLLASVIAFAGWAVLGAYRVMSAELQVRALPWGWPAFVVFLAVYLAGFSLASPGRLQYAWDAVLICGLLAAVAVSYLTLFAEPTGPVVLRRVWVRVARREWRRSLEELPGWIVNYTIAVIFALSAAATVDFGISREGVLEFFSAAPLAIALFLTRDAALYLGFAFSRRPRRAEGAALFYLVMVYLVIPWLLHAAQWERAAELLLPPIFDRPGFSVGVLAVHCILTAGFAAWRWRAYGRS